jgi:hypothetical protein
MKFLLATVLFTAFGVHAAAPVICEGTQDGKQISFSMGRDDLGQISSITAYVNGEEFASFSGQRQVVVTEHAYGTVVHGRARLGDINGLMVLLDNKGRDSWGHEGWITYYGNLSVSGVNLTCQF